MLAVRLRGFMIARLHRDLEAVRETPTEKFSTPTEELPATTAEKLAAPCLCIRGAGRSAPTRKCRSQTLPRRVAIQPLAHSPSASWGRDRTIRGLPVSNLTAMGATAHSGRAANREKQ